MDWRSALILIVAVLLGGLVAFIGDMLGSIIGKKRISLFKLRPRHTARVAIIGMGMLIPVVTLMVTLVGSEDVRQWLLNGPALIKKRDSLQEETNQLSKDKLTLGAEKDSLVKQKKAQEKETFVLGQKLTSAREQYKLQGARMASLQKKMSVLTGRSLQLTSQIKGLSSRLKATLARITEVQKQYKAVQVQAAALNTSYKELFSSYQALRNTNEDYLKRNAELDKANTNLKKAEEKLKEDAAKLDEEIKALEDKKAEVEKKLSVLDRELLSTQANNKWLQLGIRYSRYAPLVFPIGEEIGRLPVSAGKGVKRSNKALETLLSLCRTKALEKGAQDFPDAPAASLEKESDIEALKAELDQHSSEAVLIARVAWNAFKSEPVTIQVEIRDNPLIYKSGTRIVSGLIDCGVSRQEIFDQIKDFLAVRLSNKVLGDQMIPFSGPSNSVGEVSAGQVTNLIQQLVQQGNRRVRLVAVAKGDTRASGPLRLDFIIE